MSLDYLKGLNKQQKEAAMHKDGPLLVLAGAGTGKTHTMTVRMKHLVEHHNVSPSKILGITFTRKAANEMKERAINLIGPKGKFINLSTFHSLCATILRENIHNLKESKKNSKSGKGFDSSFTIMDKKDELFLMKEVLEELEIDTKDYPPSMFAGWISSFKNELMDVKLLEKSILLVNNPFATYFEFPPHIDMDESISMARRIPDKFHKLIVNVYKKYTNKLIDNNSCDFDDLIMLTVRLFLEEPKVLGHYQNKYDYISIDEYQDTNHAQYILSKLLAAKKKNIAVIGDDFQCLLPDTKIQTSEGIKTIQDITKEDQLVVASGEGNTTLSNPKEIESREYEGDIIVVTTESGKIIKATPKHIAFVREEEDTTETMMGFQTVMFGENYSPEEVHLHQLMFNEKNDLNVYKELKISSNYGELIDFYKTIKEEIDCPLHPIKQKAKLTSDIFTFMSFEDLKVGMYFPVEKGGRIIEDKIVNIGIEKYKGMVYDLNISHFHNYVANGVVVHNCIYGFRNADIRNILEFEKDYENTKVIKLERNYRSTQQILNRANRVIAHNLNQRKKNLWTDKKDGEEVIYEVCDDNYEEAEYIAKSILSQYPERPYKDFTILYRINAQSRSLEEAFMNHGIPYDVVGSVNFYERMEIKDIIAYLKVVTNPDDEVNLKRIINVPRRGIGKTTVEKITQYSLDNRISFWDALSKSEEFLSKSPAGKVNSFLGLINQLRAESEVLGVGMLIDVIMQDTGYIDFLKKQNTPESEDRIENLKELLNVAWEYQQQNEENSIQEFLERITLDREQQEENPEQQDFVRMMTVHASKGLEFPVVYGIGLEENILPFYKSISEDNVEEERRLCYVMVTRAKEKLYLLRAKSRFVYNDIQMNEPSRFIKEMGFKEPEEKDNGYVLPW